MTGKRHQIEYELLFACAGGSSCREAWEGRLEPVDWSKLLRLSSRHRLGPALSELLGAEPLAKQVPDELLTSLSEAYRQNSMRNLYFRAQLRRILDLLHSHDIQVIVLKGGVIGETVYRDPGIRIMMDLDLLLNESTIPDAYELLQKNGFRQLWSGDEVQPTDRHYPRLVDPSGTVPVELHRHIVSYKDQSFSIDEWWADSVTVPLARTKALAFCPERQLIHLALHFFGDMRLSRPDSAALRKLGDLARTLTTVKPELDTKRLLAIAAEQGTLPIVLTSLKVAQRLLRTEVPHELVAASDGDTADRQLDLFIERRVLRESIWLFSELVDPWDSSALDRFKSGVRRLLQPDPAYKRQRLPHHVRAGRHLSDLRETVWAYSRRPKSFFEDFETERWMTDLYQPLQPREAPLAS